MSGSGVDGHDPQRTDGGRGRIGPVIFAVIWLLLSLPIILAAVAQADALRHAAGDQAIIEMFAMDIPSSMPLVGAYSRLGFHHPGPMLHYLVAGPVHLFGAYGMNLGAAALAIASIGGLLVVMHRRGGQPLFALGAVFILVLVHSMGLDVLSVWNPYVLILPFALSVALAWSVLCGDRAALPWLAVVGSFVAQAHLGLVPAIGFLFACAGGWVVLAAVRARRGATDATSPDTAVRWGRSALLAAMALLVLWMPPLIDQVIHHPGNISRIISSGGSGDPRLGLGRALGVLGLLVGRVDPLRLDSTSDLRILQSVHDGSAWWLLVPLLVLLITVLLARRHALGAQFRLSVLLGGLVIIAAVSFATISGLPYLYLERWVVVISAFLWLVLLWTLFAVAFPDLQNRRLVPQEPTAHRRWTAVLVGVGVLLLVVSLVPLADTPGHTNDVRSSAAVASIIDTARAQVDGCGLVVVEPAATPVELQISSGVVAQLRRDGVDAVIDDAFAFAHGPQHSLRGRTADCTLVVGETGPAVDGGFPPFGVTVTRS